MKDDRRAMRDNCRSRPFTPRPAGADRRQRKVGTKGVARRATVILHPSSFILVAARPLRYLLAAPVSHTAVHTPATDSISPICTAPAFLISSTLIITASRVGPVMMCV